MLAASFRTLQDSVRLGVAMQAKKTEDRAGTASDDVELLVCRNKVIAKQLGRLESFRKQIVVAQKFRYHSQRVDDRTQTGGAADPERPGHSRRTPAAKAFAKVRDRSERELR
jgi:hypothetical protein